MKPVEDEEIIRLFLQEKKENEAFRLLVGKYKERLYWHIRKIVIGHEDSDDVLQNTFLKAWNNIGSFHGKSKLSTWLYSIAINEALDNLRKSKNSLKVGAPDNVSVAGKLMADEYFDGDEAQALLMQAVAMLPDVQRTVFNLRYFDNMKYSEMSAVLNTSEGALKASYHIAVRKISEYLHLHE